MSGPVSLVEIIKILWLCTPTIKKFFIIQPHYVYLYLKLCTCVAANPCLTF